MSGVSETVTVPEGHVFVVKQLSAYGNVTLGPAHVNFRSVDSGATLWSAGFSDGTPATFFFYGAYVFPVATSFQFEVISSLGEGLDVYAGGYDLIAP